MTVASSRSKSSSTTCQAECQEFLIYYFIQSFQFLKVSECQFTHMKRLGTSQGHKSQGSAKIHTHVSDFRIEALSCVTSTLIQY